MLKKIYLIFIKKIKILEKMLKKNLQNQHKINFDTEITSVGTDKLLPKVTNENPEVKINNPKALESLLKKLKKVKNNTLYVYDNLKYPHSDESLNDFRKDKFLFENYLKEKFDGKIPLSCFIAHKETFDLYKFLDDEFDNLKIFYYQFDLSIEPKEAKQFYVNFQKTKISLFPQLQIAFEYMGEYFMFTGYSLWAYYMDTIKFYKAAEKFTLIVQNYNVPIPKTQNHVYMIMKDYNGYYLKEFKIEKTETTILQNYDDNFIEVDKIIRKKLNDSNKGIILLHGERGTGKTYYIRDLTSKIDKKFIFIPSFLSVQLTDTDFISFLVKQCTESILIFEDAEKIVKSRENDYYNGTISDLLNLADGILGDVIKSQIICTFNIGITSIDEALLRPGRLIAEYEFKKLSWNKAKEVAKQLKKTLKEEREYSLAEIYKSDDLPAIFKNPSKKTMGFGPN